MRDELCCMRGKAEGDDFVFLANINKLQRAMLPISINEEHLVFAHLSLPSVILKVP